MAERPRRKRGQQKQPGRRSPPPEASPGRSVPLLDEPKPESLLDVVDTLIDQGLSLDGEIVLGLADVDLVYIRLGALVAAADRVLEPDPGASPPDPLNSLPRRSSPRERRRAPTRATLSSPRATPRRASVPRSSPAALRAAPAGSHSTRQGTAPVATDETSRSVMRLVLTLVDFIRQLLERQAVRRVQERTLTSDEIERLGAALMRLESTIAELAERHGLEPADLNLDLGPLGRLT